MRRLCPLLLLLAACSTASASAPAPAPDDAARGRLRRPDLLIPALQLPPAARVADVGAGDGYLTAHLAALPGARVVATDLDGLALLRAAARLARAGTPAELRLVRRPGSPSLETSTYDLILLAQVDHLLPDRVAYLHALRPALAAGGRIAVSNRAVYAAPLRAAAAAAGYDIHAVAVDLPAQHLYILTPAERR